MKTYSTTVVVGMLVAFVGWLAVGLGSVMFVLAVLKSGIYALGVPAIGLVFAGLLAVCQGQLIQAVADTARNTGELVALLKQDLSVTRTSEQRLDRHADGPTAESLS